MPNKKITDKGGDALIFYGKYRKVWWYGFLNYTITVYNIQAPSPKKFAPRRQL